MVTEHDLYWLAGYLEGEGSFMRGSPSDPGNSKISVCSTDEDVIAKVGKLFGNTPYLAKRKISNPKHKPVWTVKKSGRDAVALMQLLLPLMGKRRHEQISKAIVSYTPSKYKRLSLDEVEKIRVLCRTDMKQGEIAQLFEIRRETVNKIKSGKFHPLNLLLPEVTSCEVFILAGSR